MALSHPQLLLVVVSRGVREREDLALTGGAKGEQADVVVIHGQRGPRRLGQSVAGVSRQLEVN
jgi:hypothetical protein